MQKKKQSVAKAIAGGTKKMDTELRSKVPVSKVKKEDDDFIKAMSMAKGYPIKKKK